MTQFSHDISCCFNEKTDNKNTPDIHQFEDILSRCNEAATLFKEKIAKGDLPLLSPFNDEEKIAEIENVATTLRENFEHIFILGTGGSTLCGQIYKDLMPLPQKNAPILHFIDNIDPDIIVPLFESVDLTKSHFIVVSKSGSTMETLAQFSVALSFAKKQIKDTDLHKHFSCISDNTPSTLREIAAQYNLTVYEHEKKIGGRFSLVTNVGLIPAAILGINIREILQGCTDAITHSLLPNSEAMKGASLHFAMMEKGLNNNVLISYTDRLKHFGVWYRQIWSESLGKDGMGTTPINAQGTLDQHSQLQLYLDGPKDKFFTFIFLKNFNHDFPMDDSFTSHPTLGYLKSNTLSNLMNASAVATRDTLINKNNPVRTITLDNLTPHAMGYLLMHFIFETVYMSGLMRIDPFDQPAVEEGKILARKLLNNNQST